MRKSAYGTKIAMALLCTTILTGGNIFFVNDALAAAHSPSVEQVDEEEVATFGGIELQNEATQLAIYSHTLDIAAQTKDAIDNGDDGNKVHKQYFAFKRDKNTGAMHVKIITRVKAHDGLHYNHIYDNTYITDAKGKIHWYANKEDAQYTGYASLYAGLPKKNSGVHTPETLQKVVEKLMEKQRNIAATNNTLVVNVGTSQRTAPVLTVEAEAKERSRLEKIAKLKSEAEAVSKGKSKNLDSHEVGKVLSKIEKQSGERFTPENRKTLSELITEHKITIKDGEVKFADQATTDKYAAIKSTEAKARAEQELRKEKRIKELGITFGPMSRPEDRDVVEKTAVQLGHATQAFDIAKTAKDNLQKQPSISLSQMEEALQNVNNSVINAQKAQDEATSKTSSTTSIEAKNNVKKIREKLDEVKGIKADLEKSLNIFKNTIKMTENYKKTAQEEANKAADIERAVKNATDLAYVELELKKVDKIAEKANNAGVNAVDAYNSPKDQNATLSIEAGSNANETTKAAKKAMDSKLKVEEKLKELQNERVRNVQPTNQTGQVGGTAPGNASQPLGDAASSDSSVQSNATQAAAASTPEATLGHGGTHPQSQPPVGGEATSSSEQGVIGSLWNGVTGIGASVSGAFRDALSETVSVIQTGASHASNVFGLSSSTQGPASPPESTPPDATSGSEAKTATHKESKGSSQQAQHRGVLQKEQGNSPKQHMKGGKASTKTATSKNKDTLEEANEDLND